MDSLRRLEVKTNNLASSQSLFSQGRMWHTSVQINEKIILIGGDQSETGEIVKEGNWENNINIACYDSSNQLWLCLIKVGRCWLFNIVEREHVLWSGKMARLGKMASSQLGVLLVEVTPMGRWTGVQIITVISIILFLSEVQLWRQIPGFPSRPGHTKSWACLLKLFHERRAGENIHKLSNYLSSVFQTGLACCWRWLPWLPWLLSEHRNILQWSMENSRKPSQVKTFVKSFELFIV